MLVKVILPTDRLIAISDSKQDKKLSETLVHP